MSPRSRAFPRELMRLGVLASSMLLFSPNPALAESTNDESAISSASITAEKKRVLAEEHFRRGLALAKAPSNWEAALAEFLESRRLLPTRSATRNAAIASQALGRYADALEFYDALLAEFAEMSDAERNTYEIERRGLLQYFGQITIRVNEGGVTVVVDGRERGVSPLVGPLHLQGGTHIVHARKEGFYDVDRQVFVPTGGQRALVFEMKPVSGARVLAVREANGERLDVVLDAATVGQTPWSGTASAGLHSVLLRGHRRGTAPVTVDLQLKPKLDLTLRAVALDAEATIDPTPSGATIYVDGELAGSGAWSGRLPSGTHRIDVIAPDHLPFRGDLTLAPGASLVVTPKLALNRPARPTSLRFYLEPSAGLLFGRTLRGDVDLACDCQTRARPFGWSTSFRAGYSILPHVAPELSLGFMRVTERSTRTMHAEGEQDRYGFVSRDERDSVAAAGPFLSAGAAARFFERLPVTARLSVGAALLGLSFSNAGNFNGFVADGGGLKPAGGYLSVEEPSARAFVPFVATELRAGYAFTRKLSADFGVSLAAFLPPAVRRLDRGGVPTGPDSTGIGFLTLPDETAMRAFLLVSPSLALRLEL